MADGILGLLGAGLDKVQGLLSNPMLQGVALTAATGANPLLGLLAGPIIKNSREQKALENDLLRQSLLDAKRRSTAQRDLTGLLGEQTHVPVSAPIGLMNVEGGETMIPATRRQAVPTVATPQGQERLLGLLSQIAPAQVAEKFLAQPSAPEFKTDVGKLFADLETAELTGNMAAADALRGAIDRQLGPDVNLDDVRSARNDVIKNSQGFLASQAGFQRVVAGATDNSGAGDIALLFGYMKTLDPTSTVREGEFALAGQVGGIAEQFRSLYNRLVSGERLTPDQRQEFITAAHKQFGNIVGQQNRVIEDARGFATRNDLPSQDVIPEFVIPTFDPDQEFDFSSQSSPSDALDEAAAQASAAGKGAVVRVADIARMSLQKLEALDPSKMSREALEAAARRYEELARGR